MVNKNTTEVGAVDVSRRNMLAKSAKYAALVPVSTLIAANAASAHSWPGASGGSTLNDCITWKDSSGLTGNKPHCEGNHSGTDFP